MSPQIWLARVAGARWLAVLLGLLVAGLAGARQAGAFQDALVIPEGATTQADYWKGNVEFHAREARLYAKLTEDSPEAKALAPEFFHAAWETLHGKGTPNTDDGKGPDPRQMGEKLIALGSRDPLVLYYHGAILRDLGDRDSAKKWLDMAVGRFLASAYPRGLLFPIYVVRHDVIRTSGDLEALRASRKQLIDLAPEWLSYAAESPGHQRYAWDQYVRVCEDSSRYLSHDDQRTMVEAYGRTEKKDPWLWEMMQGQYERDAAWHFRGSGYADTVTEEGWRLFAEHLSRAAPHFRRAYDLTPEYPEAATALITIAMGGHEEEPERVWLDRAIAGQCDYLPAYNAMLFSLMPRWGGSHEEMLEFGEFCAATERYDTLIPFVYCNAVRSIKNDLTGGKDIFQKPGVYERLTEVLTRLSEAPAEVRQSWVPVYSKRHFQTWQLAAAMHAERFSEARKLAERWGDQVDKKQLKSLGFAYDYDLSRVYAYDELGSELVEVRRLTFTPRNDPSNARKMLKGYTALLQKSQQPRAKRYLETWVRRAGMEVAFHEGKWVELTCDPQLTDWKQRSGEWEVENEHSVVGSNFSGDWGMDLTHHCEFPGPRELECEVEVLERRTPWLFVGCFLGMTDSEGGMFWMEPKRLQAGIQGLNENDPLGARMYFPRPMKKLRVKIWGPDYFEMIVDDLPINNAHQHPEMVLASNRVGVGALGWGKMSLGIGKVRFQNMRVRKISASPPPPFEDYQARLEYYDRAVERDPDLSEYYAQRGLAKYFLKQYEAAIPDLEKAVKGNPVEYRRETILGSAYCELGKYQEGIAHLEVSAKAATRHPVEDALIEPRMLALFLAAAPDDKVRNGKRALRIAEGLCQLTQNQDFDCLWALAAAQTEVGQFDEAAKTAELLGQLAKEDEQRENLSKLKGNLSARKPWRVTPGG